MVHAYNPSTTKAQTGEPEVQGPLAFALACLLVAVAWPALFYPQTLQNQGLHVCLIGLYLEGKDSSP